MIARMTEIQKLKQKSQSNIFEMSLGAVDIIKSRTPILPINKIMNADANAKHSTFTKYNADIILSLLW